MITNNKKATLKRMFTGLVAAGMIGGMSATATFAAGQRPQFNRGGQANVVRQQPSAGRQAQPSFSRPAQQNFSRPAQQNFARHDAAPIVRGNQNFGRDNHDTRVRVDNRFNFGGREGFRPNVVVRERPFISVGIGGGYGAYSYASVADQNGYRDGFQAGRSDALNGRGQDCDDNPIFRSGLSGYIGTYGAQNLYRSAYQQGFERGYADGVRSV